MIAKLKGIITDFLPSAVIIEAAGVGYRVEISGSGLNKGEELEVYIYTYVRENEIRLLGFRELKELVLFEKLLLVSGVGPRLAQSLIGYLGYNEIIIAITQDEPARLKVPGIGSKTAQRIILELKSKLDINMVEHSATKQPRIARSEIIQALSGLGYKQAEIEIILPRLDGKLNIDEQIKQALKLLKK